MDDSKLQPIDVVHKFLGAPATLDHGEWLASEVIVTRSGSLKRQPFRKAEEVHQ